MTRRPTLLIVIVAIGAIVGVITATSGGAHRKATPAAPATSAISLRQTAIGNTLVDANGRTLYLFLGDGPNVSRLSAAGQQVWPPFTSAKLPAATGGTSAARIGTIPASGQITYNGHPLYYYAGDQHPGQISGQGLNEFGARWYVLSASGAAITAAAPSESAASSAGGEEGGGLRY
jgi:predicted lipoprotein with Yx(FWY)xxD motif